MRLIEKIWFAPQRVNYGLASLFTLLLLPFSGLFYLLSTSRRYLYQLGLLKVVEVSKPVIVVGNISVGGNGKTPLVLWLIEQCKLLGLTVGVLSRGYGGNAENHPLLLDESTTAVQAGDEPVMIYKRTGVAVVVGSDRVASAEKLIAQGCNIIISDDGLQHYRLGRAVEIAVIDGKRGFGNSLLMPAGPLREGLWRLKTVDHVIVNGETALDFSKLATILMNLQARTIVNILSKEQLSIDEFLQKVTNDHHEVNAIAGIGAPQRFFDTLVSSKMNINQQKAFVDHYAYQADDFTDFTHTKNKNKNKTPLVMTEKDAVKCVGFAKNNWWYLPVDAQFDEKQITPLLTQLVALKNKTHF
ncbi:MAG: tetraacyldisaccharide 4'-kinase [Gammaproteobacteria bacterium]|nr:MAG: tetraacyldisaccharide 4'-kinase [Gammaproteobacteria bacterium]